MSMTKYDYMSSFRLVVVVGSQNQFDCSGNTLAPIRVKMRHLQALGYDICLVSMSRSHLQAWHGHTLTHPGLRHLLGKFVFQGQTLCVRFPESRFNESSARTGLRHMPGE
jgi:hypothetical protein